MNLKRKRTEREETENRSVRVVAPEAGEERQDAESPRPSDDLGVWRLDFRLRALNEILPGHRTSQPPDDPITLEIEGELANFLDGSGKWGEAAQFQTPVLEKSLKVHGEEYPWCLRFKLD